MERFCPICKSPTNQEIQVREERFEVNFQQWKCKRCGSWI